MDYDIKIPYIEIRSSATRNIIGIIEGATLLFEETYNGCGGCEVYCRATPNNISLLQAGNYITIPNDVEYIINGEEYCNIWRIKQIQRSNDKKGGRWITATGKEAKDIVGNRIIRYTAVLSGDLVTTVKEKLFNDNILNPSDTNRKIPEFIFDSSSVVRTISDDSGTETQTQATYNNLLTYTEELYSKYLCGAKLRFNKTTKNLHYVIYEGTNRTDTIVFSQANENLSSSDYSEDWTNYKTYVLVGGEDDETTKIRKVISIDDYSKGVDRYEAFVDARDVSSKYEDSQGEKTMSDAEYKLLLKSKGEEKKSAEYKKEVMFSGVIDVTSKRYKYNRDYFLGDFVLIRDTDYGDEVAVDVVKFVRVQDENGYNEYFEFEV